MDTTVTPVSIQRGTSGNWRQHDTILAFFSDCECGSRARVDWLCSGDPSAPVVKGGRKKLQRPEAIRRGVLSGLGYPPPRRERQRRKARGIRSKCSKEGPGAYRRQFDEDRSGSPSSSTATTTTTSSATIVVAASADASAAAVACAAPAAACAAAALSATAATVAFATTNTAAADDDDYPNAAAACDFNASLGCSRVESFRSAIGAFCSAPPYAGNLLAKETAPLFSTSASDERGVMGAELGKGGVAGSCSPAFCQCVCYCVRVCLPLPHATSPPSLPSRRIYAGCV